MTNHYSGNRPSLLPMLVVAAVTGLSGLDEAVLLVSASAGLHFLLGRVSAVVGL